MDEYGGEALRLAPQGDYERGKRTPASVLAAVSGALRCPAVSTNTGTPTA